MISNKANSALVDEEKEGTIIVAELERISKREAEVGHERMLLLLLLVAAAKKI